MLAIMIFSSTWFSDGAVLIKYNTIFASSAHIDSNREGDYFAVETNEQSNKNVNSKLKSDLSGGNKVLDNKGSLDNSTASVYWNSSSFCSNTFKCIISFTTGWNDNESVQISSSIINNSIGTPISIIGQEVKVIPKERYILVIHMRTQFALDSHVILQGFNESSKAWNKIERCPSDINRPVDWEEYKCIISIDTNITRIRPVLNAGGLVNSSTESITWFDYIHMNKINPHTYDTNLTTELVYEGLEGPVSMAFLSPDDFLVAENKGTVQRITNGKIIVDPVVSLDVAENQGLLGIAIEKKSDGIKKIYSNYHPYIFLYYTANEKSSNLATGKDGVSNRLYRYELVEDKLVNSKKLLELPAEYDHNGGPLLIGTDNKSVYVSVGDLENQSYVMIPHKALNNNTGTKPDGSGGILRVTLDGEPVNDGIIGNTYPVNLYYAYGIRECFGMDFDPISGELWTTENGANYGDEINLVIEGFNGGWSKVQGIWRNIGYNTPASKDMDSNPQDLEDFGGKGKYKSPKFTWNHTVAPTALKFISTDKLGKQYQNDMLVADVNNGRIYHFDLNQNRTQLLLKGPLSDKIADNNEELQNVIFAEGFGAITDLKIDSKGDLYVVVFDEGKIYRITHR